MGGSFRKETGHEENCYQVDKDEQEKTQEKEIANAGCLLSEHDRSRLPLVDFESSVSVARRGGRELTDHAQFHYSLAP